MVKKKTEKRASEHMENRLWSLQRKEEVGQKHQKLSTEEISIKAKCLHPKCDSLKTRVSRWLV